MIRLGPVTMSLIESQCCSLALDARAVTRLLRRAQDRQALARELIDSPADGLEINALKTKVLFSHPVLEHAAVDGTLWPPLYQLWRTSFGT